MKQVKILKTIRWDEDIMNYLIDKAAKENKKSVAIVVNEILRTAMNAELDGEK